VYGYGENKQPQPAQGGVWSLDARRFMHVRHETLRVNEKERSRNHA
jgi:hypothetical protein